MKKPISVLSNVFYLLASFAMLAIGERGDHLVAVPLLALSYASFVFHYNEEKKGTLEHYADLAAMYLVLLMMIWHAYGQQADVLVMAIILFLAALFALDTLNSTYVVGIAFLLIMIGLITNSCGWLWTIPATIGAGAMALRKFSSDSDFLHGVWHMLTAVAIFIAWLIA